MPLTASRPRLGFLGLGWIGRSRLDAIAASGLAEVAALADPAVPEALDTLEAEERHRVYKMLRLSTLAHPDGTLEVSGAIGEDVTVCINDSAS